MQFKRVFIVVIVVGIQIANSRKLHNSEERVKTKSTSNADYKDEVSTLHNKSSESLEAFDGSKQPERKPHKREQRTFGVVYSLTDSKSKPKRKPKTIEAPYPNETPYLKGAPYPKQAPYPKEAPYPEEAPYPKDANRPTLSSSNGQKKKSRKDVVQSSTPLVATNIEIRRAVPFENDHISRHYASKFRFPPATLLSPEARKFGQKVISVPFVNVPESNVQNNENVDIQSHLPPVKMFAPGLKAHQYQKSPSNFKTPSFLLNADDESSQFRNPLGPTQTLVPSSTVDQDATRFIPWTPSGYEYLRRLDPLDRSAPEQAPSTGFNMEVSEIVEPAFIVPENVGKVDITIPPPFAPLRTHALSINDAQITRNEVRKDNGEFLSRSVKHECCKL